MRLVVFGVLDGDWHTALHPGADVWRLLPSVRDVVCVPHDRAQALRYVQDSSMPGLLLPVHEDDQLGWPASVRALVPGTDAQATLRNKGSFAAFVAERGLDALVPRTFACADEATFPAVLKRLDLTAGTGIREVDSAHTLAEALQCDPFAGHDTLLQECVLEGPEYVTHGVCLDGSWRWSTTLEYLQPERARFHMPGRASDVRVTHGMESAVEAFEEVTMQLGFSGPCNIDHRMRGGSPVIFEINPRLGYSLMRPESTELLAQALSAVFALA